LEIHVNPVLTFPADITFVACQELQAALLLFDLPVAKHSPGLIHSLFRP